MAMFGESFSEAWRQRYGTEAPGDFPEAALPPGFARLLTHRSVRDFSDRAIPEATVRALVGAAQSAATSSNLHLYSIVSVQDRARREALAAISGGQQQVRDAAWFFVFVADHYRLARAARAAGVEPAALDYCEFFTMAVVDAALAAERMVCAAEALGLGTCYIGALRNDAEGVKRALKLPELTFGVFGLCVGYPAETCAAEIKPRLAPEALWFREAYQLEPDVAEYDARLREFDRVQGGRSDVPWSLRSSKRVSGRRPTGRETLKSWLEGQGFQRR